MPASSRFAVAVHVLTLLAWAGDEPLKSGYVARSVNTNPVVIRRILCALARAGMVVSQTGAAGGTRLARRPDQITLRQVYRAVEPREIFMLHRQRPDPRCPVGMNIEGSLGEVLSAVDAAVDKVLGRLTVESVLQSVKPCAPSRAARRR